MDRTVYKAEVEITSTHKYIGESYPATATSSPRWRILRIDLVTNACQWAESGEFQVAWDDRATVSYA